MTEKGNANAITAVFSKMSDLSEYLKKRKRYAEADKEYRELLKRLEEKGFQSFHK